MHIIDLSGQTFGRWTVISRAENTPQGQAKWRCRCSCGNEKDLKSIVIRRGLSQSCGCLKLEMVIARSTKHGHATNGISPTYHSWASMLARCDNPKNTRYADWGGRGITVCDRWRDFRNFLEDMGEKPEGMSLDRIDNSGNYEPGNCRWSTLSEQNSNRRGLQPITHNGKTMTAAAWGKELGLSTTLYSRLHRGWSIERALSQPLRDRSKS